VADALPVVIGLCPEHAGEFYVPHGGVCPECSEELMTYVRTADAEHGREQLVAALRRAHKLLDAEHGHSVATWADRVRWTSDA
jgi:hypothetical protein